MSAADGATKLLSGANPALLWLCRAILRGVDDDVAHVHRTDRRETKFPSGVPFQIDLLEQPLDEHFPDFSGPGLLSWGIAFRAVANAWTMEHRLAGIDWEIILAPSGEFAFPSVNSQGPLADAPITVDEPCALFAIHTSERSVDAARDVGRAAVRALASLVRREIPVLLLDRPIWEGAIKRTDDQRKMLMTVAHSTLSLTASLEQHNRELDAVRLRLANMSLAALPMRLARALEFVALARGSSGRAESFVCLWLSVIALVSYGQPTRASDRARIEAYTHRMTTGEAGVRSAAAVDALNAQFERAKSARDKLFHRDDSTAITDELLRDLERAAFQLVDFELALLRRR